MNNKPHSEESKLKISLSKIGKGLKENHHNWKGGMSKCLDCGKVLSSRIAKRCVPCDNELKKVRPQIRKEKTLEEKLYHSQRTKEGMTQEVRDKISAAMRGIPSPIKGTKTGRTPWNKGLKGYNSGIKSATYKTGPPKCIDCGIDNKDYHKGRCRACNTIFMRGSNIYNWKGGSGIIAAIRSSFEYGQWRLNVYKRDWYSCQICGHKGNDIEAHHIKKFSENIHLATDLDNGITLCVNCHKQLRFKENEYIDTFTKIIHAKKLTP